MTDVHVVLPDNVDDPRRPSGGNVYDRQVCRGLAAIGWSVCERLVPCRGWPRVDPKTQAGLADMLGGIPRGSIVLLDGLVASVAPATMASYAGRLRLVVLLHTPTGEAPERESLSAATAVVTTSRWTRQRLHQLYALPADHIRVVEPGATAAEPAPGTAAGTELLSVAAVTLGKGHDILLQALAALHGLDWRQTCVGSLDLRPDYVAGLRHQAEALGIADRVAFTGPLTGPDLDAAYRASDILLLPSRAETYGMVVTEALAHGLPVLATRVGGVPEALGRTADGTRPGLLVPAEDPRAFADALRGWLCDAGRREALRAAATERRRTLPDWRSASRRMSRILAEVAG